MTGLHNNAMNLVLTRSRCKTIGPYGEIGISRARRSSTPARPYIWRLQSIHLAFDGPVAPGLGDGRFHRENVALQSGLEILDQG